MSKFDITVPRVSEVDARLHAGTHVPGEEEEWTLLSRVNWVPRWLAYLIAAFGSSKRGPRGCALRCACGEKGRRTPRVSCACHGQTCSLACQCIFLWSHRSSQRRVVQLNRMVCKCHVHTVRLHVHHKTDTSSLIVQMLLSWCFGLDKICAVSLSHIHTT